MWYVSRIIPQKGDAVAMSKLAHRGHTGVVNADGARGWNYLFTQLNPVEPYNWYTLAMRFGHQASKEGRSVPAKFDSCANR